MKCFLKRTGLLCLLVLLLPDLSWAKIYSGLCGEIVRWKLDTETGLLDIYNSQPGAYSKMIDYSYSLSAPWYEYRESIRSVNLSGILKIGDWAFYGCSGLTSVTIPEGVTSIGYYAFVYCSGLTSVTIPKSVTSIGGNAFQNCSSLTSITIPEGVTSIGISAFYGCSGLTSITIPESVTTIGNYAFRGCSGLTSITIPEGVKSIGYYAFAYCSGLTSVTIPKSVTSIGDEAFSGCYFSRDKFINKSQLSNYYNWGVTLCDEETSDGLFIEDFIVVKCRPWVSSVCIPEGVTGIGGSAFSGRSGLTSVTIPEGVTSIGSYAFSSCSSLTSVTIPESVTSIGGSAFYKCTGLTSITIPESVTSIGDNAFHGCKGLTSVTIPEGVTSIGNDAFYGCSGLTTITIPESVTNIGTSVFSGCSGLTSVELNSSAITSATYSSLYNIGSIFGSQVKKYIIGGSRITDYAFYECSGLESVTLSDRVTSIGNYAFSGCSGLTSVTIPESVTSIGGSAFSSCSGLTSITIPEGVASIGSSAFDGCSGLTSITIPEGVTSIGDYAFFGCSGLTSITIPEGVASIGRYAFSRCSGLTSVTIPESVTNIGDGAFSSCSGLTSITIPESVTSISSSAFDGCSGLTSITIPKGVTSIGSSAFSGCSRLTSIELNSNTISSAKYSSTKNFGTLFGSQVKEYIFGNNVSTIGDYAFYGCSNMTAITIPKSVTSIDSYAFYGCANLTTLNLDCENVGSWFANNTKLVSLTLGEHVKIIGQKAFSGCTGLRSVTIPANVIGIDQTAFNGCTDIKLNAVRGTDGMLSVWNYGADPYEFGSSELLERPLLSMVSATQTSIIYQVDNVYPEIEYLYDYNSSPLGNNEYLVSGLRPELSQPFRLVVKSANNSYSTQFNMETLPISPKLVCEGATASSLSVRGNYTEGDAKVVSTSLIVNGKELGQENGTMYELDPNTPYYCEYRVVVEYGNDELYTYYGTDYFSTNELSMVTQQPKVISAGNIIVAADTNLSEEESKTGFEWRRIDWTDDFTSNYGGAFLYGGRMEGYIRNLNTDRLWKYRAYYESDSGKRYYGQWVGIDPTNTSYFEPTVYTYAQFVVNDNTAEVKGYAMRGTEDVRKQGFMYWKKESSSIGGISNNIPASAMTVEAKGNVMVATLENLDYDTEYSYVAFATTADNETFYGEEQMFKTGTASQEVIDGIEGTEDAAVLTEVARYDLNGRKISSPQKGINIIRQSDGTVKKVMVK